MNGRLLDVLLVGALCVALPACAESLAENATKARFDNRQVELIEHEGRCSLTDGERRIDLLIKWPCQFHRDDEGELRTVEVAGAEVMLVESSEKMPTPSKDCRTEIQAVRTQGDELEPSPSISRVSACPPFQWDEKVFIGLFEPQA
jgi:hypothetical protein